MPPPLPSQTDPISLCKAVTGLGHGSVHRVLAAVLVLHFVELLTRTTLDVSTFHMHALTVYADSVRP